MTGTMKLFNLLWQSVQSAISKVHGPTVLQLSGGLDSAILHALVPFAHCYVCSWPEFDNETMAREALGGKGELHTVTFTREQMIEEALPEVARITCGQGTWSQCCQWYLDRAAAADGAKGIANGEGADEYYGGYARYRILYWLDRMRNDPHLVEYQGFCDMVVGAREDTLCRCCRARDLNGYSETKHLTEQAALYDQGRPLLNLLDFEDQIAASHGLVHIHPFMNPEVIEFAQGLCEDDKIDELESKSVLRDVARAAGVSQKIIDEQTKRGLVVPPSWAPDGERKWSRGWFEQEMQRAWKACQIEDRVEERSA